MLTVLVKSWPQMLRIEIDIYEGSKTLRLSGDLRAGDLEELLPHFRDPIPVSSLDLEDLMIVDLIAVRFLIGYEDRGIRIVACPSYVREWMNREKERRKQN
jgi:hypothetical protein